MGTAVESQTDQVYVTPNIEVQPSTGTLAVKKLLITDTTMINHIEFKRNGWNYIAASGGSDGVFAFVAGGKSASGANSTLAIHGSKIIPGQTDNKIDMGDSSYHFKDLYIKGQIKNGSYTYTLPSATGTLALTSDLPSDTWRKIQVNGTDILGTATNTNPLNLKAGSNVTITNSNGTVTFDATDTGATAVTTTGSGNAFTSAEYNAGTRTITFTKGSTFLTSHQSIKTLKTNNTTAQTTSASEAIAGSGTINLHKVSKTGTYSDLIGTPDLSKYIESSGSSTDNAIVRYDGDDGKKVQNSTVKIDDSGNVTLPTGASLRLDTYGTRFLTLTGNSISADMSKETGGWAGAFASVKDPSGTTTTMLGWYGGASGLTHIFMGGSYSDPALKMTGSGNFTIKKPLTIAETTDAPFVVNSTAVVSNLNADLLDGNHASAFATKTDLDKYLPKTTYEWNKEYAAGSNGAVSLGRYNLYDTQLTFDITTTTTITISGKLVIAAQNGQILKVTVYGDASNTLAGYITIYQSAITGSRSWIEVFCNFPGWSKNKVHIYAVALNSATVTRQMTSVTFTGGVPSGVTSGDSKWTGTIVNDITSNCAAIDHTHDDRYVKYNAAQTLTDAQKTQARTNIGAGTSSFSGNYNDLTNKPTIPTVNNAKLTIQKNGTTVQTFTANASTDVTANITVPTKTSELTNDSGFWTGTKYWANVAVSGSSSTATTPSVQKLGITGSTTTTASAAVTMEYDSSYKALKFVFN